MKRRTSPLFPAAIALLFLTHHAAAQDNVRGGQEPIVASIDPSKLTYDYLVDGNLTQDDPANRKFKTLQAAYAAAPAGTADKPTVIGIKPNVYHLPGPSTRGQSMLIEKNYITFLGLTNNRRAVVLADNRGNQQGSEDNGYILDVNATGFSLRNLTVLNYCNADYEYPGDPSKNLTKRSNVITQAVSLTTAGDKHVYENVALLSRLDTMFLRTTRSYFKNVFIEGTDDFIGGGQVSYWEDCTVIFPTGHGVMLASGIVFKNTKFEATRGLQFYKGLGRPATLIDCILPVDSPQNFVSWLRAKPTPRINLHSLTYRLKDTNGKPTRIRDSSYGDAAFTYSRELSAQEVLAFNPWNLLRAAPTGAADDWDPAGVKAKYEAAGQGNLVYRMALNNPNPTIRTGGPGATISASVNPARAVPAIKWTTTSNLISLEPASGSSVVVTGKNTTSQTQWVPVNATADNGFYVTAYVCVEPKFIDPPAVIGAPTLNRPANGTITVNYRLDLGGKEDQSIVSWSICDDAAGANPRQIAASRGNQPLKALPLTSGYVGKFIKVSVAPKHPISDPGAPVSVVAAAPITAADVTTTKISPNFKNFVVTPNATFVSGLWTVNGTWTIAEGEEYENGYGIRPGSVASLLYQQDVERGDMQVDLIMSPEKTEGTGFSVPGSPADVGPRNLHSDVFIKYDPRTGNGYSLRIWRTTQSAAKCMYQLYKIENGAGSPLNDKQVLTGVFKPNTRMTVKVVGSTLSVTASNNVDNEVLSLEGTITPNRFGGAGVFWPGGSTNIYSRIEISYPGVK